MFDSCIGCGAFAPDVGFKRDGDVFVCPRCGHRRTISLSDLFVVFGPSGSGKTSLWNYTLTRPDRPGLVYLNGDILWSLAQYIGSYVSYWMFICANISQSGRPVVLFIGIEPVEFEKSDRRDLFGKVHYLALVCSDEELKRRLLTRPSSRRSSDPQVIAQMQEWNRALKERAWSDSVVAARGAFEALETTGKSLDETAEEFFQWLNQRLD